MNGYMNKQNYRICDNLNQHEIQDLMNTEKPLFSMDFAIFLFPGSLYIQITKNLFWPEEQFLRAWRVTLHGGYL